MGFTAITGSFHCTLAFLPFPLLPTEPFLLPVPAPFRKGLSLKDPLQTQPLSEPPLTLNSNWLQGPAKDPSKTGTDLRGGENLSPSGVVRVGAEADISHCFW